MSENVIGRWHMTFGSCSLVDLFLHLLCKAETFYSVTISLISRVKSRIRFLLARNLALIIIHRITLDLCGPCSVIVSRSFIIYLTLQFSVVHQLLCESLPIFLPCYLLPGHWLLIFLVTLTFQLKVKP